jgi:hypothetical protein
MFLLFFYLYLVFDFVFFSLVASCTGQRPTISKSSTVANFSQMAWAETLKRQILLVKIALQLKPELTGCHFARSKECNTFRAPNFVLILQFIKWGRRWWWCRWTSI